MCPSSPWSSPFRFLWADIAMRHVSYAFLLFFSKYHCTNPCTYSVDCFQLAINSGLEAWTLHNMSAKGKFLFCVFIYFVTIAKVEINAMVIVISFPLGRHCYATCKSCVFIVFFSKYQCSKPCTFNVDCFSARN